MKPLIRNNCGDVRALPMRSWAVCSCGESRGRYTDNVNAVLEGRSMLPLGFRNDTFRAAIRQARYDQEHGIRGDLGHEFTAFMIPWTATSIQYVRTCPCREESVAAKPDGVDRPCSCGKFMLSVAATHLHGVFVGKDPLAPRPQANRLRRKRVR